MINRHLPIDEEYLRSTSGVLLMLRLVPNLGSSAYEEVERSHFIFTLVQGALFFWAQ